MTKKTYRIKNKFRFYTFLLVLTVILALVFMFFLQNSAKANKKIDYNTIIVKSGDTLWDIAKSENYNIDTREYIYQIRKINNLSDANLIPGQSLILPVIE